MWSGFVFCIETLIRGVAPSFQANGLLLSGKHVTKFLIFILLIYVSRITAACLQ